MQLGVDGDGVRVANCVMGNVGELRPLMDSFDQSWHSPVLTFHNLMLEREYREYLLRASHGVSKRLYPFFVLFAVVMGIAHCFRWLVSDKLPGTPSPLLPFLAACVVLFVYGLYLHRCRRETWPTRTCTTVAVRCSLAAVSAMGHIFYNNRAPVVNTAQLLWVQLTFKTGILMAVMPALGFRLLFKHHIVFQTVIVLLQMMVMSGRLCDHLTWSDGVIKDRMQKLGTDCPEASDIERPNLTQFSAIDHLSVLHRCLSSLVCLIIHCPSCTSQPCGQSICKTTVIFLQLALAWWLPTAVLYLLERRSRAHFLLNVRRDHEQESFMLEVERQGNHAKSWFDRLCHVGMSLIPIGSSLWFLMCAWTLFSWIV